MLIRIVLENFKSFNERMEFNMLPNRRYSKKNSHKYDLGDIELLKMSALYGANAAGKSNLIEAMIFLQRLVLQENIPSGVSAKKFRLSKAAETAPITIAVEFVTESNPFVYAVQVQESYIQTEELYISGMGRAADELVFERQHIEGKTKLRFFDRFYDKNENKVLLDVIEKNLIKKEKPLLKFLSDLSHEDLSVIKDSFNWFAHTIQVISPNSNVTALAHHIDIDQRFSDYAKNIMRSYHVGIKDLVVDKKDIRDYFGEDDDELIRKITEGLERSGTDHVALARNREGHEVVVVKEQEKLVVKELKIIHEGADSTVYFDTSEESDGTQRLLDFIPAFQTIVNHRSVFLIDEIERSIHPLIIKKLIEKFSSDPDTKGQLIFTTHESNLLDQKVFRMDEIWFAEKDQAGSTDLYSLSKFKEHHTIDIQKGYLAGRYGGIPFLGNLEDLSWHLYDFVEG